MRLAPQSYTEVKCMRHDACAACTCTWVLCSRKRIDANGGQRQEQEILEINVRPGWKAGTKITFQDKGECTQKHNAPCLALTRARFAAMRGTRC